ncbi:MAG: hypothetical protein FJ098_01920 [Deltaproteobacteria bacterium]|nr:hypothetical protein [Deltaproteobacteria bacterium]
MRGESRWVLVVAAMSLGACDGGGGTGEGNGGAVEPLVVEAVETVLMGAEDNAEVVKMIPGQARGLLVSSKARKLTLLAAGEGGLEVLRERVLFENDASESELTHAAVSPDGTWAVCTRTLLETGPDGAQTDCGGELVFVDVTDSGTFGEVLVRVPVGPMPDSVAISPDGLLVASANERDGPEAWGKCEVPGEEASLSILSVEGGPAAATELHRVRMVDGDTGPREPESVVFGGDGDLVVATLQDSHEVLFVRVSDLAGVEDPDSSLEVVRIVRLPDDPTGAGPWPDGVARAVSGGGEELFVVAGEWNDTFTVLDGEGQVLSSTALDPGDFPVTLPRVLDEGSPRFSPDSVTTFSARGRVHAAFSLRHAGAVAFYDLSDPAAPVFESATAVGKSEAGGQDAEGSTIRPEGLDASPDGAFLLVANEGESSVTLLAPLD